MEADEVIKTFRKCELFGQLSEKELLSIANLGSIKKYEAGEIIYEQGVLGTKLYILSKGQASLYRRIDLGNARTADAAVFVLREKAQRRLMGGWCTLLGEQHVQMCTARCDKPSKIVSLDCSDLREIITTHPNIRLMILEKLVLILRDRIESSYGAMEAL
jgi:CRP-like cAMP-binding protein